MLCVASHGPDNPNQAVLPFAALKGSLGAAADGTFPEERPEMFLMQEAVYLATRTIPLEELKAVGLPPISEFLEALTAKGFRMIVCRPCAEGRGISEADLAAYAEMGEGKDLATLTTQHSQVLTF